MNTSFANNNLFLPGSLLNISERNRLAGDLIKGYALGHSLTDVGIGLFGTFVPIPGAGIAALLTSLLIQAPLFYQPMVRELAGIYSATPEELLAKTSSRNAFTFPESLQASFVRQATTSNTANLLTEFGAEFLGKLIWKLLRERNITLAAGLLPVIGGTLSAALDATFAATLTWRIGKMIAIYFQHNGWINTREETYERARVMTPWSLFQENNLDLIPERVPEVQQKQIGWILELAKHLQQTVPDNTLDQIRIQLKNQGLPDKAIDGALNYL